jgi:cytochrome c oxidase cbb3-type subunit I/II
VAVAAGGAFEIIPSLAIESNVPTISSVRPYSPLELEGRDIYVGEGCYTCHSQMVRPFRDETERYGEYSKPGEFIYDRPFQFGSRRIGPDLHRVGGKYNDMWHYNHMLNPQSTSEGSLMPAYSWLFEDALDLSLTSAKLKAFQRFKAPYSDEQVMSAAADAQAQADKIADALLAQGAAQDIRHKQVVAVIAYLQRLGTDIKGDIKGPGEVAP